MKKSIKHIDRVAQRIKTAIQKKERIIIYADSDADGVCSAVILQESIKSLGGEVVRVFFPNREEDGYGVNMRAVELLRTSNLGGLFITLDLGISNNAEIALLNEMGFEVIVVDHHQPPDVLPPASIVIDPKQVGDDSGSTYLANVGITFKLAEELLRDNFSVMQKNSFLELVALATISDMVPQIEDNVGYIEEGLRSLTNTVRPALRAFLEVLGSGSVATGLHMRIIASINAAESVDFVNSAFVLLTTADIRLCLDLAQELLGKVSFKQQIVKQVVSEVERRMLSKKEDEIIIFEGDPAWKLTLAGPVCSIIAQKYAKPTFIYKKMDKESCGSVRSLGEGENAVDAMKSCSDILITYGGHPKAAGFRLANENLEEFKKRLIEYFSK